MGSAKQEQEIIHAKAGQVWGGRLRERPETRDHCSSGVLIRRGIYTQKKEPRKAHRALERLPGSELECSGSFQGPTIHPKMCAYLELFMNGAFVEEAPAEIRTWGSLEISTL